MINAQIFNQVDAREIEIILRELGKVISTDSRGDVVEFGCYLGGTSVRIAQALQSAGSKRNYYVYDSFAGLPEKSAKDVSPLGVQFKAGELVASKKQFVKNISRAKVPMPIIKKAWFSELTLADIPNEIIFAFLDGDYYSSVKESLQLVVPNLVPGSTLVVDDYGNQSLPGVSRAINEWSASNNANIQIEHTLALIKPGIKR